MNNNPFSKNTDFKKKLELNPKNLCVFDQEIINSLELNFKIIDNPLSNGELQNYTTFKVIKIDDINFLRSKLKTLNTGEQNWCAKILRFLEFRFSTLKERFKINYKNKKERVVFTQNLISLMLEYSYYFKEERFLGLAIKLMKIQVFNETSSAQTAYNFLLAKYLIENYK